MRRTACVILVIGGATVGATVAAPRAHAVVCPGAADVPTAATVAAARRATLCLVNAERAKRGIPIVHTTPPMRATAKRYAFNMMHTNFFSHVTPAGRRLIDRVRESGYDSPRYRVRVGESLGWGRDEHARPQELVAKMMASPTHARVLLDPIYRDAGIGVAFGAPRVIPPGHTAATYALEFGMRRLR